MLLGSTILFNILGHQRRFRHRAWEVRQVLLRGSNFDMRFFACRKSTTRDPRLYFPSEGSHSQDFLRSKKSIDTGRVWNRKPSILWWDVKILIRLYCFNNCNINAIVALCIVIIVMMYGMRLVSFLLSSDIRSEGSIAIVKKFYFDFLMIFDSISLPHSKNVFR